MDGELYELGKEGLVIRLRVPLESPLQRLIEWWPL